jgi:F-type H+-transporting ATPase subunit c
MRAAESTFQAGSRFRPACIGREREGASTVSINHPLTVHSWKLRRNTMRKLQILFTTLGVLFLAAPAFAQDAGGNGMAIGLTSIAAGIGMGLAAGLCGLGQGRATASATEALARNPGARPGILLLLTLGLAFIESLSLFTLVIIFVKVTAHP